MQMKYFFILLIITLFPNFYCSAESTEGTTTSISDENSSKEEFTIRMPDKEEIPEPKEEKTAEAPQPQSKEGKKTEAEAMPGAPQDDEREPVAQYRSLPVKILRIARRRCYLMFYARYPDLKLLEHKE